MVKRNSRRYLPIETVSEVTSVNYLQVDFRNLLTSRSIEGYQGGIDQFWKAGRVIERAAGAGLSDRIHDLHNYYLEGVQWLKGQSQTSRGAVLSPLDLNSEPAAYHALLTNFVQSWLPNFQNEFFNTPVLVSYYLKADSGGGSVLKTTHIEAINQAAAEEISEIRKVSVEEQSTIKKVAALSEWQQYFDELITSDHERFIPGKRSWRLIWNKLTQKKYYFRHIFPYYRDTALNYHYQMVHHKFWKNVWLMCFVIAQIGLELVNIYWLHWTLQANLLEIISTKLVIAVMFGILFTSANKNYRIYANLYDQTRFRSVVARTLQGVIIQDDSRIDPKYKELLLTVAGQSLFEMKPNGHLTKKETASPVSELLAALVTKP